MFCGCRGHGRSQILFALGQAEKRSPRHANCRLAPPHALLQQASCASAAQEEIQQLCRQGHLDLAIHVMCHLQCPTTDPAYMSLLDACSKNKALHHAQQVHIHLTKHDLILANCPLGNYLVETFAKCGSIDDALHVFHRLPHHTVLSWTAIISAYTESGRAREALKFHHLMLEERVQPNRFTYITLLKACSSISALEEGRNIHDALRKKGFVSNVFVGSALVNMYGKCGSIKEAEIVFCELPVRNVVTWNALLSAYIEQNDGERALRLYRQMHQEGMNPYERTYVIALQACSIFAEMEEASSVEKQKVISLEIGRAVHVDAVKNGATASDVFMGSALLSMYGKSGSFTEAENVLSELPKHYTVFWNVLLSAYVKHKQGKKALHLYTKMLHEGTSPDELIFVAVLQACVIFAENENSSFVDGRPLKVFCSEVVKALHQDAQRKGFCSDIFFASTLINAHGSCGDIIDADTVFQGLFKRDIVTWNSMLSAYIDQGQGEKALQLYRQMQEECTVKEERTSVIALQACCILAEQDSYINLIPGQSIKAMSLWLGQAVHADARRKGFDSEIFICNTLVSMYSKCGDIVKVENVFYGMSKRDKVSWCVMLTAYLEHDEAEKALWLFRQMQVDGMILDKLHYVVAFQACGSLPEEEEAVFVEEHSIKLCSLRIAKAIHAYGEVQNFISDVIVGSTLVSVY